MAAFDFTARTALVAGGTSGINLDIAEAFADAGANVVVLSRSQERVDAAVQQLRSRGARDVLGFMADVRDADAVKAAHCSRARARYFSKPSLTSMGEETSSQIHDDQKTQQSCWTHCPLQEGHKQVEAISIITSAHISR
jgi:short chain dehydrogenase